MFSLMLFLLGFFVSAVAIRYAIVLARRFGIVDKPGGHKAHDTVTPFVGGVGVFAAVLCGLVVVGEFPVPKGGHAQAFLVGVVAMFVTGFIDDIVHLNFKLRLVVQITVALVMVYLGGVVLSDLGYLFTDQPVQVGLGAVALTVVATVGAINALNMIDGIDGLSGSLSLVSLLSIATAVYVAGDVAYFSQIVILAGGVAGFLYFNLRYLKQRRARCFLGDNGSMLLGFVFAWLLSDLSQASDGSPRAIAPVTTLWLFAVPLIDTLCVMLRRVWMGRSPFHADRNHLHHLFLRAGFRVQDTVVVLACVQALFSAVGLLGLHLGVGDGVMLVAFAFMSMLCFWVLLRPWRLVPQLRSFQSVLGLTSVHAVGVHVGGLTEARLVVMSTVLTATIGRYVDFRFRVYRAEAGEGGDCYGIIELFCDDGEERAHHEISRIIAALRRATRRHPGIQVRQFVDRLAANDRRVAAAQGRPVDRRSRDRRSTGRAVLIYSLDSAAGESSVLANNN